MKNFLVFIVCLFMVAGCAAKRDSALKQDAKVFTTATQDGDLESVLKEAMTHWDKRLKKAELIKAIELMDAAIASKTPDLSPEQRSEKIAEIYELQSRAYYFLADSHIRLEAQDDEKDDEMMAIFAKGLTSAEKAIALRAPDFSAKIASDQNLWQSEVVKADPKAIPAFYWYATNLGKWALLEGVATILARKDDIKSTMDWIVSTNGTYFYGAPHRYFGTYHTKVPIGRGNPTGSKTSYEKSIKIGPTNLATPVLMAQSYATLIGDRALFEKLLKEVIATAPDVDPALSAENTLEIKKAKRLLKQADDLFY